VPCWLVGDRSGETASLFVADLADRLRHHVQLNTDGHKPYLEAVVGAFGADIDYSMLIKLYSQEPGEERRYSPPKCIGAEPRVILGNAGAAHISTSYAERQNLKMRMSMRRVTRLTNAFPKKVEKLAAAVSLHFMDYNFARVHKTLGTTPAVAAGVADHEWALAEIVALLDRD
jgi:hypothetical protein